MHTNIVCDPAVVTIPRTCARCGERFGSIGREYTCRHCRRSRRDQLEQRKQNISAQPLSPREQQIIALVCKAKSNTEIGHELELTYGSVSVYMHRLFTKVKVSNRTELALKFAGENNGVSGQ